MDRGNRFDQSFSSQVVQVQLKSSIFGLIDSDQSRNLNHGETSRTECDQEEGRGDQEEDRHQSQAEEGSRPSSRIIIIITAIDPLQIRGSELDEAG